jgi:hypothetical protein
VHALAALIVVLEEMSDVGIESTIRCAYQLALQDLLL